MSVSADGFHTATRRPVLHPFSGRLAALKQLLRRKLEIRSSCRTLQSSLIRTRFSYVVMWSQQRLNKKFEMAIPTVTDKRGAFVATFKIRGNDDGHGPSVRTSLVDSPLEISQISNTFLLAFQAHIVNASVLAQADSSVIHYS
jgi:hypothetical protein